MQPRASASFLLALLLLAAALPAQSEEWSIPLADGVFLAQENTVYDIIRRDLQPLRGTILAANETTVKLAVSQSADQVDVDVVYLPVATIKTIRERAGLELRVRENPPAVVRDPYDLTLRGLGETGEEGTTDTPEEMTPEIPVIPADDISESFGPIDPGVQRQVDALLARIAPPAGEDPTPEQLAAAAQQALGAEEGLYALGAGATGALTARLDGSSRMQLEALTQVLLRLNETRSINPILVQYDMRGIFPEEETLTLLASSGMAPALDWLVRGAQDGSRSEGRRVRLCTALLAAPASDQVAEAMRRLVLTEPRESQVPLAALDAYIHQASDPISGLLEFLSQDLVHLYSILLPELSTAEDETLNDRLYEMHRSGSSSPTTRETIMQVLCRRVSTDPLRGRMLRWFVEQAAKARDEAIVALALESLVPAGLPGRQDGSVEYDGLVRQALQVDASARLVTAGLDALHLMETEVSLGLVEALLELWKELEAHSPDEVRERNLKEIKERIPRVVRRITGENITRPEALESWLDQQ